MQICDNTHNYYKFRSVNDHCEIPILLRYGRALSIRVPLEISEWRHMHRRYALEDIL